ncbi:MAG: response regulator [Acidobacteria bacterium]|nr:response regulator [Acidobacteriota bacterium]
MTTPPGMDGILLESVLEHAAVPMAIMAVTGEVEWANPAFTELTGYRVADLIGRGAWRYATPSPADHDAIERAVLAGQIWRGYIWSHRRDGSAYVAETVIGPVRGSDGAIRRCFAVKCDVTSTFREERRTHEAKEGLDLAAETAGLGFWDWDLRTGAMAFNRVLQDMTGYSPDQVKASFHAWRGLLHPEDAGGVLAGLLACLRGKRPDFDAVFRVRQADGGYRHMRGRGRVVHRDGAGKALRFIGTFLEVSGQVRMEQQARQAGKLEALGLLASGVAHDFNNLLTVINGNLELLRSRVDHDEASLRCVELAAGAGNRAATLSQRVLSFSRPEEQRYAVVSFNDAVNEAVRFAAQLIEEDIRLETSLEPELRTVCGDIALFQQVMVNLILNARDAPPRGGRIRIETRNVDLAEPVLAGNEELPSGSYVQVTVADSGEGMDEETLAQIFQPFDTARSRRGGPGLGLSTAYATVRQFGGGIGVESRAGSGTTFRIYLPAAEGAAEETPQPVCQVSGGDATILLVEDDGDVRHFATTALENRGYTVLAAADAAEAERMAAGSTIDAVVADVILPDGRGTELAARLRLRQPDLRVLFISGYGPDAFEEGDAEAESFLPKPFTADLLALRLAEVLHSGRRRCAMVVDDDPAILRFLAGALGQAGFDVITAGDGREAMALAAARQVDIVVTDLVMPEVEGIELIGSLRRLRPPMPVVAISGAFNGDFLRVAVGLGAQAALAKPFTAEQLVASVRCALQSVNGHG